ncbi:hypothetical protein [Compostimonas suwonensis]|uniref:hypothetical protein n=1 Tax=Compostimonas suwonensis TaxID=1048394 RepID=UPI001B807335|nr:hypothetical protein [Compostimonas suwonensis]
MQIAEERVREDVGEHEPLLGDVVEKRDADLVVNRLLGLIQVDLLRLVTEDLAGLRGESSRFFWLQRCLTVTGLRCPSSALCAHREEPFLPKVASAQRTGPLHE